MEIKRMNIVRDSLYNCHPHSASEQYAKGQIVGLVSGLMAQGDSLEHVLSVLWFEVENKIYDLTHEHVKNCLPNCWKPLYQSGHFLMKGKAMKAEIGSVSNGTMRIEDLIPCFLDVAKALGCNPEWINNMRIEAEKEDYYSSEKSNYDLEELFDVLNEKAPPYCYFGAHPGDGADYGFWPNIDSLHYDFGEYENELKVDDTSEIPEDFQGFVLHINDHGNMTLYSVENGKLTEEWAII